MALRSKTRTISHLAIVALIVLLGWLAWRLDYGLEWLAGPQPEPMFAPEDLPPLVASEEMQELEATEEAQDPEAIEEAQEPETVVEAEAEAPEVPPEPAAAEHALEVEALFEAWGRARHLLRQRDLAGAEVAYLELAERWPKHPDLIGELGNVYVLLGEQASARAAFERARELLEPMGPSLPLQSVTRWLEQNR